MIVDAHVHLTIPGFVRGKFLLGNARVASHMYNRVNGTKLTPSEYIDTLKSRRDPDCTKLLAAMDNAGIDKSIIFGVDWAYARTGEPRVSNRDQNRIHCEMAQKYPDRFVALAALDPRRPDFMEQATEAVEVFGARGFKLHPSAGFFPTDECCFPLYEKCTEWGLPIMFHSGGIEGNWICAQPQYIATVAEHYPDVKMIMGHAGLENWRTALAAAEMLPNIYLDISIHQFYYRLNPAKFYRWLRKLIDGAGPEKILFASDAPMPNSWVPLDEWVKAINEPRSGEVEFTREELDIVMGSSSQNVFNC